MEIKLRVAGLHALKAAVRLQKAYDTKLGAGELYQSRHGFFKTVDLNGKAAFAVPVVSNRLTACRGKGAIATKHITKVIKCYEEEALVKATDNWSMKNMLGDGGCGVVHKGWLFDEFQWVAIKRVGMSKCSTDMLIEQSFYHELNMSHNHQNLVTLKGFCPSAAALVYEYMEGGNLE